jgi:FAD/FMN-containing dehydrogenase
MEVGRVAEITVTNWFGNIVSHPSVVVDTNSVDDIVRVLKDPTQFPSPVRAVGSNLFAFPEEEYAAAITDFFKFVKDYYTQKGYRSNLLYVGYWILKDQQALLSYSYNGNVMTIDPVSTGNPGWGEFLAAYNLFCSDRNGVPLLNQSYGLTPAIVRKAYGDRWTMLQTARKQYDPNGRLLNDYFRNLMS